MEHERKLVRNAWFAKWIPGYPGEIWDVREPPKWLICQVERVRRNLNGLSDDDKASLVRTNGFHGRCW